VIVKDDYDAEFRYDRQAVGSLKGLAPDRTVLCRGIAAIGDLLDASDCVLARRSPPPAIDASSSTTRLGTAAG